MHFQRRSLLGICLFGVVWAAAATAPLGAQEPPPPPAEEPLVLEAYPVTPDLESLSGGYRIGRQDLLEIRVFGVEELDQTARVAEDGSITMPLLGRLSVAGLTKTEVEGTIANLLSGRFVRDPQVTVFVKEYESRKVAVSGAVKKPGTYEMLGRKTLLEMISLAGGLDVDMGKEIIIFRRTADNLTQRIPVNLERLVFAADPKLNLVLEPSDIIYVPTVEKVRIFVSGAVQNPNLYEVPRDEPVTVLKAITLAGGTTDRAAEKKVQIMRTDGDGNRVALVVDLRKIMRGKAEDPILQEEDIVLVPEAFF